jgi:hypothetical protein
MNTYVSGVFIDLDRGQSRFGVDYQDLVFIDLPLKYHLV